MTLTFAPGATPTSQRTVDSPAGPLVLMGNQEHLTHLLFDRTVPGAQSISAAVTPDVDPNAFGDVVAQLEEYFAGTRTAFDVSVAPLGTAFQLDVWRALTTIPYAETLSYGALANRVGRPGAARAVGAANARNPISIIVPCHRVIGASGAMTGYGGGIDNKSLLLSLECEDRRPRLPLGV